MSMEFEMVYWYWLMLAVVLLTLELLAPAAFFLCMAFSAAIVGGFKGLIPSLSWELQVFIFSVLSIASVVGWRYYLRRNPTETDRPLLNRRSAQYIGRVFTLDEAIVNGSGKIKVDDSTWKVRGPDCPAQTKVKVVSVDSVILEVEALENTT